MRFRAFDLNLKRFMAQRAELDGSKITLDTIAKRLGKLGKGVGPG
jgi:hypothetical protein